MKRAFAILAPALFLPGILQAGTVSLPEPVYPECQAVVDRIEGASAGNFRLLGDRYRLGLGVEPSAETAFCLYLVGAHEGEIEATTMTGVSRDRGEGIEFDLELAYRWYSIAARSGDVSAQQLLASTYSSGGGVDLNLTRSYAWHTIAALGGSQYSRGQLRFLERQMSPEALDRASAMARRCMESNYQDC